MSGSRSILDDVVVTPVALMPALPDGYGPSTTLSRQILTPTGRKLQFGAPFFVRGLSAAQLTNNWSATCAILRRYGLPLFATTADLQDVPAVNVPARIAQRFLGQPFIHNEVTTSDAYELSNCAANGIGWGWPYEISSGRDLKGLVNVLRDATRGETPIGMSLPLNAKAADMRMCIESSVDFLTLTHCAESLVSAADRIASLAAYGIASARKLCTQFGRPTLPLLLDAPISDSDHVIKLLALGASAINVAALLQAAMPVAETPRYESKLTDSLLGSLPSTPKVVRDLPQVDRTVSQLIQRLSQTLQFTGLVDIADLDSDCLRGLNTHAAEQLGIAAIAVR